MTGRLTFDQELKDLHDTLIKMGKVVENAIDESILALKNKDIEVAKRIIEGDNVVDELEKEIEHKCLLLILRQQPVAGDLRKISTALKIITDMERIGDHAADIAELTIDIADGNVYGSTKEIVPMTEVAISMVRDAIIAFIRDDLELARDVRTRDDVVDNLFRQYKLELAEVIRSGKDTGEHALNYLMIAKYLERIADHAVNICEWIEFAQTGEHVWPR
ncbi:MAG: phosphate signaling complex protein PhoU [Bacillota bacterium]|jgi:phosphate transport system protein|nr:phosphate signaling complex protein PhoU [Bacillota bacterium]HOP54109.1 phosphate signaling complex protein PhoU [Bacillota bacterium]HPT60913.1 phosphate signaling complex protein PhoU [Bacillota bacterium]HPZ73522.1 phosphate signaling complex protein PhoU [Bacillota bacterium]HQD78414.1 phosphate signaling complex protein PhoU [Bacillota bacterium]